MNSAEIKKDVIEVVFCLGSSCFSRGTNRGLELLQIWLKENDLENRVLLQGHLCQGKCQDGPNMTIDGQVYRSVDPGVVLDLVKHHLNNK
ncbi:MAG: NAD(P)H-dependent oxidoreductase subunit E [Planctomycetota bacterium]|jgi:NADH:ubiquinone oxidoreductase subunit E